MEGIEINTMVAELKVLYLMTESSVTKGIETQRKVIETPGKRKLFSREINLGRLQEGAMLELTL